jgi:hypothetical protein
VPHKETVNRTVNILVQIVLLFGGGKCQVLIEEKLDEIDAGLQHSLRKSPRCLGQEMSVKFTVLPKKNLSL